jgi:hypothetical protein
MVAIPTWLTTPGNTSVVITGQTVAVDGTLADGVSPAAQTVTGSLVSIEENLITEQNEVSPITTTVANNVNEFVNNGYRIGILVNGSGVVNPLKTLGGTYDVMKVVFIAKASGATTTPTAASMTYYGRRAEITTAYDNRNRIVSYLTLTSVDIGSANPVYA